MKPTHIALAAALVLAACGNPNDSSAQDSDQLTLPSRRAPLGQAEVQASFAPVVQVSAPAVVNIAAQTLVRQRDPFFEMFGGRPRERIGQSIGSGVIVRADGIVVTNNHVIEGAREILVTLNDRREFPAEILLQDRRSDLAVLQLDTSGDRLPVLAIDTSEDLQIGDLVLAIGNPFGIGQSVTSGIISAVNRTDGGDDGRAYIQTDAAINQGNSGGALVDMDGELIGVNTMILSPSGTSAGIGFAVPASIIQRVVDSATGGATMVVRPWLGVSVAPVTAEIAQAHDLDRRRGVVVQDIYRNGPGDDAGLRVDDVITSVSGTDVNDLASFNFRVGVATPGDQIVLGIVRDGRPMTLNATVEPPPGNPDPNATQITGRNPLSGAHVAALSPALADQVGVDPLTGGVILAGVSGRSIAAAAGFRRGDIIRRINGEEVTSPAQMQALLDARQRGWEVTAVRNGRELTGRF